MSQEQAPVDFTVKHDGEKRRLVINYKQKPYGADVAQYPQCMKDVIEKLKLVDADEIVLSEYYDRIYNEEQTKLLKSVADAILKFETEAVWSPTHLSKTSESAILSPRHDVVLTVLNAFHEDPFKAYLLLLQNIKTELAKSQSLSPDALEDEQVFISTLQYMRSEMEKTELISRMRKYLAQLGELPSDRSIYSSFFEISIKPSFIGSRIFFTGTETLQLVDQYQVLGTDVYIYKHPEKVELQYFVNPPEYALPPEKYFLLEKTKEVVAGHRPGEVSFMDIAQARKYFRKIYTATISDIARKNKIELSVEEIEDLAGIVARYTIGYGILELLLSDRQLTDVYIDSPLGVKPIYVVHSKYGQCQTNVIFSEEEARATVSRFRALSGRPFDEAHPILDFDLPDLQTRIAAIGKPLALDGIAFAFRLHKDTPWTLPQFLDNKMFNPLTAGLLSYFVDAQASMLIVGSRGAGKTSLLQAMMLELPTNLRIIVQEDSVTGDSQMLVEREGKMQRTTAGALIDGLMEKYGYSEIGGKQVLLFNSEGVKVHSVSPSFKQSLSRVSQFTRHKVNKSIFEVETRAGRKIKVTCDHSLFTLGNFGLTPKKTNELKPGDFIATPRMLSPGCGVRDFDLLPHLLEEEKGFVIGGGLLQWMRENRADVARAGAEKGFHKTTVQNWFRKKMLPVFLFKKFALREKEWAAGLSFKIDSTSTPLPLKIVASEDFLCFAGLWLADGCFDGKYGVIISVGDERERAVVKRIADSLGLSVRTHSDGFSRIISNTNLVWLLKKLEFAGDAFTKKMPSWAFQLGAMQSAALLRGLFSGDGYCSKNEVAIRLQSEQLIKDAECLLLSQGVISRRGFVKRDESFDLRISATDALREFSKIGFLQGYKQERLKALCERVSTHASSDVVPLTAEMRNWAVGQKLLPKHDYVSRNFNPGRMKVSSVCANSNSSGTHELQLLQQLSCSDVFWDEVKSVRQVSSSAWVYDFSVPGNENFVCENIIAHNTQELPVPALKRLGMSIQRLKTRPPLGAQSEAEVSAEDALRTALRLGDSVLIVGEVRSLEARALYEAMRVGAVGNVVMGTIHGESAYSIWDRVVNDLGVPTTSFKATDFAIVSAPIRFKGSLKRNRRLIEITEVKKEWNEDPLKENGFLQWMTFDANKDDLEFFEDRLGESEWLSKIKRIRGMSIEQIWGEIRARGDSKQYLVDVKRKFDVPKILEAENSLRAHNRYLLLAEKQREEFGSVDYPSLIADWKKWVDESLAPAVVSEKQVS